MYNRIDIYNDFSDSDLTYKYKSIFNGDITASFAWYYGDTALLDFNFTFEDDSPERWENKIIEFIFSDFRHEEIYTTSVEGTNTVDLTIDTETSKLFKRGIYFCSAKIVDTITGETQTALGASDCLIYVK